ncbi:VanZ family protein [Clostridium tarantellae]|nr:VanZ family protein [Clostridium tarantellae]
MIKSLYFMLGDTFLQNISKVLIITIPLYLIFLIFKFFSKKNTKIKISKSIGEFIFLGYIVAVLVVTDIILIRTSDFSMFYEYGSRTIETTFKGIMINPSLEQVLVTLELGLNNVLLFIPFGILFPLICLNSQKRFLKTMLWALIFGISIEALQTLSGTFNHIDDILWNMLGVIVGYGFYMLANKLFKIYTPFNHNN